MAGPLGRWRKRRQESSRHLNRNKAAADAATEAAIEGAIQGAMESASAAQPVPKRQGRRASLSALPSNPRRQAQSRSNYLPGFLSHLPPRKQKNASVTSPSSTQGNVSNSSPPRRRRMVLRGLHKAASLPRLDLESERGALMLPIPPSTPPQTALPVASWNAVEVLHLSHSSPLPNEDKDDEQSQASRSPTKSPNRSRSQSPTRSVTMSPSQSPTKSLTKSPSASPTKSVTRSLSKSPGKGPSTSPGRSLTATAATTHALLAVAALPPLSDQPPTIIVSRDQPPRHPRQRRASISGPIGGSLVAGSFSTPRPPPKISALATTPVPTLLVTPRQHVFRRASMSTLSESPLTLTPCTTSSSGWDIMLLTPGSISHEDLTLTPGSSAGFLGYQDHASARAADVHHWGAAGSRDQAPAPGQRRASISGSVMSPLVRGTSQRSFVSSHLVRRVSQRSILSQSRPPPPSTPPRPRLTRRASMSSVLSPQESRFATGCEEPATALGVAPRRNLEDSSHARSGGLAAARAYARGDGPLPPSRSPSRVTVSPDTSSSDSTISSNLRWEEQRPKLTRRASLGALPEGKVSRVDNPAQNAAPVRRAPETGKEPQQRPTLTQRASTGGLCGGQVSRVNAKQTTPPVRCLPEKSSSSALRLDEQPQRPMLTRRASMGGVYLGQVSRGGGAQIAPPVRRLPEKTSSSALRMDEQPSQRPSQRPMLTRRASVGTLQVARAMATADEEEGSVSSRFASNAPPVRRLPEKSSSSALRMDEQPTSRPRPTLTRRASLSALNAAEAFAESKNEALTKTKSHHDEPPIRRVPESSSSSVSREENEPSSRRQLLTRRASCGNFSAAQAYAMTTHQVLTAASSSHSSRTTPSPGFAVSSGVSPPRQPRRASMNGVTLIPSKTARTEPSRPSDRAPPRRPRRASCSACTRDAFLTTDESPAGPAYWTPKTNTQAFYFSKTGDSLPILPFIGSKS
jgi:hypothetical protein